MLYKYKSDENVQDFIFECFCPLLEDVLDEYNNLRRNESLAIYMPSDMATEFVGMLLNEDIGLYVHEHSENHLLHEDTDVLISIFDDGMLFVESARGLDGLKKSPDSSLIYFYDGYKHKELKQLNDGDTSILVYGFTDNFCDEYEDEGFLDLITDENDDIVGFRAYKETDNGSFCGYSFYSSNGMDEDDIYGYLRKIWMV